mgnify:CR=1 FL=1
MPESKVYTHRGESRVQFNMTPMIDCVFLLLIFFLVATQIKESETRVRLKLPESTEALEHLLDKMKPAPITVNILPKRPGEVGIGAHPYWVMGVPLDLVGLKRILRIQAKKQYALEGGAEATVRIRADRKSELQQLQWALKACQEERILRVFIAAEKVPVPPKYW